MLNCNPKFVTVDDFNNYFGRNLRNMLRNDDNISNQAEIFLMQTEDRLINWINNNTFRRLRFDELTPYQMENFQKAILTQAMYRWKEGDLGLDSGYDAEKGVLVDRKTLVELEVCQVAINYLSNAGLFNLTMKNRPRVLHGYPATELGAFFEPSRPQPCPPEPKPEPCEPKCEGTILGSYDYEIVD